MYHRGIDRCFSSILLRRQAVAAVRCNHYDVVIGGGGIMGCSTAYFLSQRIAPHKICIIERDPRISLANRSCKPAQLYEKASTVLSVGSIRQQFSLEANIMLSLRSAHFLKAVSNHLLVDESDPPDINFTEGGYLFLASNQGESMLVTNHQTQRKMGASNQLLSPPELGSLYPWLNTEGLALGSLGLENEGWFDPYLLLSAFKRKVLSLGVHYVHGEVDALDINNESVRNVKVLCPPSSSTNRSIECKYFVNAGGPHAANMAAMAGIGSQSHPNPLMHVELPVKPRKRTVFVVSCPDGPSEMPLLIDSSGFFIRRESQKSTYICGISPDKANDPDADDLNIDYQLFEEKVWPLLAHRIPAFEACKVLSAWAGYYEYNTFDQNGIIGVHPYITNFLFVNGFSGHGIQQSPEVGKAASEIILDGSPKERELKKLGFERIINHQPLFESNIV